MTKLKRSSDLPEIIEDPVLGSLRFLSSLDGMDEYRANLKIDGFNVSVDLYTDNKGKLTPCISRARRIVGRYDAIKINMHRYIKRQIFPTYNEVWRADNEPLTEEQIIEQLKLDSITTHPTPEATFWFHAGNLFLGHALQLRMADRNRIVDHDMIG